MIFEPSNKDRKFLPRYHVSEVADMLGIHPQSIRYYDKVGVVVPSKDHHTNKRLYSSYDVFRIMQVKQYQNIGFSLDDIRLMFNTADVTEFVDKLSDKIEAKKQEILLLQNYLESSQRLRQRLQGVDLFENRCFFRIRSPQYHHEHLRDGKIVTGEDACKARDIAMKVLPRCDYSLILRKRDIEEKQKDAKSAGCDICIDVGYQDILGFDQLENSHLIGQQTCIFTVCKVEAYQEISWNHLLYVQQFLDFNRLRITDDVYATVIINALDSNNSRYRYFEVWVPIESL